MGLLTRMFDAIAYRLDWYWTGHVDWMAFNFFLAILPIALAVPLFHQGTRRTPLWFVGFGLFLLLLPYTPYVLSDVIHFHAAVASSRSPARGVIEFAPLYILYFGAAVAMYAWTIRRAVPTIVELGRSRVSHRTATWSLHAMAVFGIYVGRVTRLQAWHPFTDPAVTVDRLHSMCDARMLVIAPTTLLLGGATWLTLAAFDRATAITGRLRCT